MALNQQVAKFKEMKSKWTDDYIKQSLFMIYIGTEDYFDFVKNNPTPDTSKQQAFVCSVISQLRKDIKVSCQQTYIIYIV